MFYVVVVVLCGGCGGGGGGGGGGAGGFVVVLFCCCFPEKFNRFQTMKETSATPRIVISFVISRDASNRLHKEDTMRDNESKYSTS